MSEFRPATLEREFTITRGARFYRDGDAVMFVFIADPSTIVGPRPATAGDRGNYPTEYREFSEQDMTQAQAVAPESPVIKPLDMAAELEPAGEASADAYPGLTPAQEVALDLDGDARPGGSLSRQAIMAKLGDLKIPFSFSETRDQLAAKLAEAGR